MKKYIQPCTACEQYMVNSPLCILFGSTPGVKQDEAPLPSGDPNA